VAYPHPDLEPILKPTYGVILYQEQVMQIAQVLAGYSLGGADLLRRAMGKKKVEEMDKQRAIFEQGAVERGVEAETATYIFDLMEKFAGYGFNKSHSAAYALVSYQTLWLKAHYPAAFMAAVLSADMDNTDKVVTLIDECRSQGLAVEPPKVNRSEYHFTIDGERTVVYGLGAIKGVGESAIAAILEARRDGAFRDLWDLCRRVDLHKVNKRVFEALIRAGALDGLGGGFGADPVGAGPNRATLTNLLPAAIQLAEQHQEQQSSGQADLFGALFADQAEDSAAVAEPDPQLAAQRWPDWDEDERLLGEKETLGLYLTGHPVNRYDAELNVLVAQRIGPLLASSHGLADPGVTQLRGGDRDQRTVAGLVHQIQVRKGARGRMASLTLDDRTGRIEVTCFNDVYEQARELLQPDAILVISGNLRADDYTGGVGLIARGVQTLEQARAGRAEHLLLRLDLAEPAAHAKGLERVQRLHELLQPYSGEGTPLRLHYRRPGCEGRLRLGENWRVTPADALLKRLRGLLGDDGVEVVYERERVVAAPPAPVAAGRPQLAVVR
jgi:DNA polymerase-3 subunit alpha